MIMHKNRIYLYISVLLFAGCVDWESPENTIPEVTTELVDTYSVTSATLTGNVSNNSSSYFLLATNPELTDAVKVSARVASEDSIAWNRYAELSNLSEGTTYYVALCATDGKSVVNGNVTSFTTKKYLGVDSVVVEKWDKTGTEPLNEDFVLGTFLTDEGGTVSPDFANIRTSYNADEGKWKFEQNLLTDTLIGYSAYSYYPYVESSSSDTYETRGVTLFERNIDYLYGVCNTSIVSGNSSVSLIMKHALAKVILNFSTEDSKTYTYLNMTLGNTSCDVKHIFTEGDLNLRTGEFTNKKFDEGYNRVLDKTLEIGRPQSVEILVIPAEFGDDEVELDIWTLGLTIAIPSSKWEAGYTYQYDVVIKNTSLEISDVYVLPWSDIDKGNINILDYK